jgi:hypothetical protein
MIIASSVSRFKLGCVCSVEANHCAGGGLPAKTVLMHADARCTIFLVPFRPSLCVPSDLIPVPSRLTISLIASLCISTSLPCTTRKTLISNVVRQLARCTKRWEIVYQGDRSRCLSRTGVGIEKLRSPCWRCASNVYGSSFSAYMHIALPSLVPL